MLVSVTDVTEDERVAYSLLTSPELLELERRASLLGAPAAIVPVGGSVSLVCGCSVTL